jgi:hypothetical protein
VTDFVTATLIVIANTSIDAVVVVDVVVVISSACSDVCTILF